VSILPTNSQLHSFSAYDQTEPKGTARYLAHARKLGFIETALTPEAISTLIYKAKGDLTLLPEKTQQDLRRIGPTVRYLNCNHDSSTNLRHIEWTGKMVSALAQFFPNLEKLNFNGSLIKEFDGFLQALLPLKNLKTLSMNDISLKDRHIDQLTKSTGINALSCCLSIAGIEKKTTAVFPRLVENDSRLSELISPQAKIEKLADGFEWVEGPIWNKKERFLLFSDIPRNAIFKWKEGENVSLYLQPSGYLGKTVYPGKEPGSNGLTYDNKGQLHLCQHGERRIVRLGPNNEQIVVADNYQGKRLNSPNDLVFKSTGELYFTDPPYGLPLRFDDPAKELPFSGVYRVKDGVVELLTKELMIPNGLAFSPDEKYLYVSNTGNKALQDLPRWYRFKVKEDGTLGEKEIFYESSLFSERRPGSPDGLKVDVEGNLYCAGPGGVYIFSPDATLLGMIEFAEPTANCNFGGEDNSWLYITSNHAVFRVHLKNKGAGV
jgi:gluconolactonase